jgi:hypothetical protein
VSLIVIRTPHARREGDNMPLFTIDNEILKMQKPTNFKLEKDIQCLIEKNLETVFNCKFIASEFFTGN